MKLLPQPHKTGFYVKGIVSERGMAVMGGGAWREKEIMHWPDSLESHLGLPYR